PAQAREAEQRQHDVVQQGLALEQGDDLVGAGETEMRPTAARHAHELAAEQADGAGVGAQLAGDQVEERGLAGAVGADDQPPLAGLDAHVHVTGDAQPAERLLQAAELERAHGPSPAPPPMALPVPLPCGTAASAAGPPRRGHQRRTAQRHSRREPGTSPSGMKTTMTTKIAPSTKFQRSI